MKKNKNKTISFDGVSLHSDVAFRLVKFNFTIQCHRKEDIKLAMTTVPFGQSFETLLIMQMFEGLEPWKVCTFAVAAMRAILITHFIRSGSNNKLILVVTRALSIFWYRWFGEPQRRINRILHVQTTGGTTNHTSFIIPRFF